MVYKKDGLMPRVWNYMNEHPNVTIIECTEAFKNDDWKNTRRCFHDWVRFIKPIRFIYFLLVDKFIAVEKLTKKEKEQLIKIEKQLGLIIKNRGICPYCKEVFLMKGMASHKTHCKERNEEDD